LSDSQNEIENDEPLPPDQWLKCGRCREPFLCVVQRGRPTFVPMFCAGCDAAMSPELAAADDRLRARLREKWSRRRRKVDMAAVADAFWGKNKSFTKRS
jgi:hypothetical protein